MGEGGGGGGGNGGMIGVNSVARDEFRFNTMKRSKPIKSTNI